MEGATAVAFWSFMSTSIKSITPAADEEEENLVA
jgi:hypothetical protein